MTAYTPYVELFGALNQVRLAVSSYSVAICVGEMWVTMWAHALNRALGLKLAGREAYLDYCLFFCSVVRAAGGRFQVIEAPAAIA